jgi:hypothetical protein
MRVFVTIATVVALVGSAASTQVGLKPEFVDSRGLSEWEIDGSGLWRMSGNVLQLHTAGVPVGPIRKPAAMAIFKSEPVGDFTLDVDVRSTAPVDLEVRDVLLIFGYQSPTRFYYVHLSKKTDAVHNGIFLVKDADRKRLDAPTSVGRLVDQAWHRVRLVRSAASGQIQVFFEGDPTPILSAVDLALPTGRVGVGSFDETAEFRALELAPSLRPRAPSR